MSNKEKSRKGKEKQPRDIKLEKRVEEEQRKLAELKEKQENEMKSGKKQLQKGKTRKKQKSGKELSDKFGSKACPKKGSYGIQERRAYHRFLEQQQRKLDYAAMFSYLGGGVKGYEYSMGDSGIVDVVYRKDETLRWETVKFYIDEQKMNSMMGIDRSWQTSDDREAYKWWRAFNMLMAFYLFEVSMT
jgi:hypothetical protein